MESCWNGSLWSNVVFGKEVIFHEFDFETSELDFEVSKSSIWKHTTLFDIGVFSYYYYLATSTTSWAQIFTGLLCYTYVKIHQVRKLVLDIYQLCPACLIHNKSQHGSTTICIFKLTPCSFVCNMAPKLCKNKNVQPHKTSCTYGQTVIPCVPAH